MLKQCQRCGNEEISENANYCKICGLKLKEAPEVPVQEQLKVINVTSSSEISRDQLTTEIKKNLSQLAKTL